MEWPRIPDWVGYLIVALVFIGALSVVAAIVGAVIWAINHVTIT